ncbi:hypothetical protein CLOM_g24044 [Closterium sp. NIES-68]|nr:hypothetical protein CLOM_g24044 [Closterium sp. NIES-68]GJP67823.1 hypothetical protein CLOP_g24591 [Closterium sp. NIES-67]GJP85314.1 hypothetical protein CLOP_g15422 [Closterium sp. NIES-67]
MCRALQTSPATFGSISFGIAATSSPPYSAPDSSQGREMLLGSSSLGILLQGERTPPPLSPPLLPPLGCHRRRAVGRPFLPLLPSSRTLGHIGS